MQEKLDPQKIVELISKSYKNKRGVFKKRVNAEDHVPRGTSKKDKALFLFYVIQLDYAVKSQRLYEGAKKLWRKNFQYFQPEFILKKSDANLKSVLQRYLKPRYINEAVKRYKVNSQTLIEKYDANPLSIFTSKKDAIKIEKLLREFRGFGPKIGNFFLRVMINTFDFNLKNLEKILQPVDIHDVRLTYDWRLINSSEMSKKNIDRVKKIWQKACKKARISWLLFDRALWILGSEGVRTGNAIDDLSHNLALPKEKKPHIQREAF